MVSGTSCQRLTNDPASGYHQLSGNFFGLGSMLLICSGKFEIFMMFMVGEFKQSFVVLLGMLLS